MDLPGDHPPSAPDRGTAPTGHGHGASAEQLDGDVDEPLPSRRGRDIGMALAGLLAGVLLTFVVVALTTDGGTEAGGEDEAAVAVGEAELADRDRQIEELDARVMDLEAQLAEVGDDTADRDAELSAQREALDERQAALDARAEELDDRQAALDERSAALDQREAALADAEGDAGATPGDTGGTTGDDGGSGGDGGIDLDELGETAEGVIDRLLDEIRDLFGRD